MGETLTVRLDPRRWRREGDVYLPLQLRRPTEGPPGSLPRVEVQEVDGALVAVTACPGPIREHPLYYTHTDAGFVLSDDVDDAVRGLDPGTLDEGVALEVACFGYATGDRTLHRARSVPAGSVLTADAGGVRITDGWIYNALPIIERPFAESARELRLRAERVFGDALARLSGRQFLLPLSGGYDSRFVAAMLKLAGVEDVVCFAWGSEGNADVETSRTIAQRLGYRWVRVDYRAEAWRAVIDEDVHREALDSVSAWTGISGTASLPFQRLLRDGLADGTYDPDRAVVALGHSGDFVAGSHIPDNLLPGDSVEAVARILLDRHRLRDCRHVPLLAGGIEGQVAALAERLGAPWRALEAWDARERQAKFIVQTNRYYERFGLDWFMPLWDPRFADFWQTVPLEQRRHLVLYDRFLEEGPFTELGLRFPRDARRRKNPLEAALRGRLMRIQPLARLQEKRRRRRPPGDEFGFNTFGPLIEQHARRAHPDGMRRVDDLLARHRVTGAKNAYAQIAAYSLARMLERRTEGARPLSTLDPAPPTP